MGKRILLVDNDEQFTELLREALALSGHRIDVCLRSGDVPSAARFVRPDGIISEARMEGVGGLGLLYLLSVQPDLCDTPVLLHTAVSQGEMAPWLERLRDYPVTILYKLSDLGELEAWVNTL